MAVKVAINGFGRIGRNVLRAIIESGRTDIQVVAINDLGPVETNAHLLRFDSVHGKFPHDVKVSGDTIDVGRGPIKVTAERDPAKLPHKELGVEIALECTGIFTARDKAAAHLTAGAKRVLVSAPADGADLTVVYGVNHDKLANVPPGVRILNASAPGFAATQLTLNVISGQTLTQNISLSPTLLTGELRITLNWTRDANGAPDDLDAHLYGPTTNNRCFEVYYSNKGSLTAAPFAMLEVDNIRADGDPPTETIRIAQTMAGTYRFFIYNYSGGVADALSRSRATVQIFDSSGLLRTYVVPSGTGRYWHVFELNGQTRALTDINSLSTTPPSFTCSN